MSIVGLDHVQIAAPAGCEPEARRFFGELLGLAEIEKPEPLLHRGGVWFKLGHQQLHVGVEEPFSPARKAHPALSVPPDQLDALATRLAVAGCKVIWDYSLPAVSRFFSEDPWGNRIELMAGPTPETPDAAEKGRRIFEQAVTGRWEEVRADFDDRMLAGAPIEKLIAGWEQVVGLLGPFRSLGDPQVRLIEGHTVVDVPMGFARGVMKGRVAFDPSGQVAGFFLLKPEVP